MKNKLKKRDLDFLLEVQRNLEKQIGFEHVGKEQSLDIVVDQSGSIQELGREQSSIVSDIDGTPHVFKQRFSQLLDCGHMVHSREQILGRCSYGHTVCTKETLYTCASCRCKTCEKDTLFWYNGDTTCSRRGCKRRWRKALEKRDDWEKETNKKADEPEIFRY